MPERELPPSVADLLERIGKDPVTRARLISRFSDALIELGVKPEDVHLISGLQIIERHGGAEMMEAEDAGIVIISRSDTRRNTESIIVG